VVKEAQKMLRRVVGEDVELVSILSPSLGLVMADPGQHFRLEDCEMFGVGHSVSSKHALLHT
jgi:hypothetical protein